MLETLSSKGIIKSFTLEKNIKTSLENIVENLTKI